MRAGMVAEDRRLRQAMQQAPDSSDSFATETDLSESTGKIYVQASREPDTTLKLLSSSWLTTLFV